MRGVAIWCLLFSCVVMGSSCAEHARPPEAATNADWYSAALLKAPSVMKYARRIKANLAWMVEQDRAESVTVTVGEDLSDHFVPRLFCKVLRSGAVYIRENLDGDESWRLDRPPDR